MRKTKEPDLKMASILVVDDEKDLLETLKDFLAPKGYQSQPAVMGTMLFVNVRIKNTR